MSDFINNPNTNYLCELLLEKEVLALNNQVALPHAIRLLHLEIARVRAGFFKSDLKNCEIELPEPEGEQILMQAKVPIPNEPKHCNFVGRILGPRGLTAKELELATNTKIQIRGRGSLRDQKKEELNLERPGWAHLHEPLHVLIECEDTPNRAKIKLENAVKIVKDLLVIPPDGIDAFKKKQLMELAIINGTLRLKQNRRSSPNSPQCNVYSPTSPQPGFHQPTFSPYHSFSPQVHATPFFAHTSFSPQSSYPGPPSSVKSPLSMHSAPPGFSETFSNLNVSDQGSYPTTPKSSRVFTFNYGATPKTSLHTLQDLEENVSKLTELSPNSATNPFLTSNNFSTSPPLTLFAEAGISPDDIVDFLDAARPKTPPPLPSTFFGGLFKRNAKSLDDGLTMPKNEDLS
uniref:K Homology domain-containing protein n=1 Tax=Acrobeloides nanus TaxID=290746 RepID=A0A914EE07_9BILA